MLQDVIHAPEPLPLEGLSSPFATQMLDLYSHGYFSETPQSSHFSSSSGCSFNEISNIDLPFPSSLSETREFNENNNSSGSSSTNKNHSNNNDDNVTIFLESQQESEPDISISIPAIPIPDTYRLDHVNISSIQSQIPLTEVVGVDGGYTSYSPQAELPLVPVFEDDCPSSLLSYVCLDPPTSPCAFLDSSGMSTFLAGNLNVGLSAGASGMFPINVIAESGVEFPGENGSIYGPESVYSTEDLQVHNENQQQLVVSACGSPLTPDISALEQPTFKPKRLTVEERKEKIHKYLKKRNERNFSKKIKYACRKTLADSRPRVRGRFAKNNEELGDVVRPSYSYSNHDDEDEDEVGLREEEEMIDSSDIFAHISGVNSLMCNYPIQSWM